jgi:hypothetical protein
MGSIGPRNPLPYHIGGAPAPTERVWRALRKAVGVASSGREAAGPVDGLEDQWRIAKARAIARVDQMAELAALQSLPNKATVHLEVYEALLSTPRAATTVERQAAVAADYTAQINALIPTLRAGLMAIDSTIDVVTIDDDYAVEAQFGQYLASRTVPADYGGRLAARLPNFSTHFVLYVTWPGTWDLTKLNQVERYLNRALPSWCDYSIDNASGFYLDGGLDDLSLLDATSFD